MNIDKIFCINLNRRPDRWNKAEIQFLRSGLKVERFPAIDARDIRKVTPIDPGNNGCSLSHYFLIERAKLIGLKTIMVFEDDVELHPNFHAELEMTFSALPLDWDMLMFGGTHKEKPTPINARILKARRTLTTHGYILRETMYNQLIDRLANLTNVVDGYFSELQQTHNVYITDPVLAWQRKDFSDIQGREMDYPHLKSNDQ